MRVPAACARQRPAEWCSASFGRSRAALDGIMNSATVPQEDQYLDERILAHMVMAVDAKLIIIAPPTAAGTYKYRTLSEAWDQGVVEDMAVRAASFKMSAHRGPGHSWRRAAAVPEAPRAAWVPP